MAEKSIQERLATSCLAGGNAAYLEALWEAYLSAPNSVPQELHAYFDTLPQVNGDALPDVSHAGIIAGFKELSRHRRQSGASAEDFTIGRQAKVVRLVYAYRSHGHHKANLDPLGLQEKMDVPDLSLDFHGLSEADLDEHFGIGGFPGLEDATLREIIVALERTYCNNMGIEYLHISDQAESSWIRKRMEANHGAPQLSVEEKKKLLQEITAAEGLERYLGNKYVGQKRFSLEGGGALIPMLNQMIQRGGAQGAKEVVLGMAHRGRLNVLINLLGKSPEELFQEFEGRTELGEAEQSGDVKYHLGFSSDVDTPGGNVHLSLAFNPSHLEIVNPVIEGSVRARQDRRGDTEHMQVIPILMHGDAAFAGQGIVMETFSLSGARGYRTGGTVHVIINNQIGFTTSNPHDTRSTLYCSDLSKMVQAPVFHVNADDLESVYFVAQMALDYRMTFHKDVVIDLVCYRRHGHQEADEPRITQPIMYKKIKAHATARKLYADQLIQDGVISEAEANAAIEEYKAKMDAGEKVARAKEGTNENDYAVDWSPFTRQTWRSPGKTSISKKQMQTLAKKLEALPEGFELQAQVQKEMVARAQMTRGELPLNWGYAETMAYASLLESGSAVRLSGQDCGRGTFSHRHAVLHDQQTGTEYTPLQHVNDKQGDFTVINSVLSEAGVMGFEYGYASADPYTLVIWEAQFGDFANGAQVVIDQFISSGEQKWGRLCGLTLFLPHGYEGQGPEHSSARLERYLQLCAQHNMQVCVPSTPAQFFHMIRRQDVRPFRMPLIVMTPKSLLRHKLSVSSLEDLTEGYFHLVIPEVDELSAEKVKRIVLCSGKVYYDLLAHRRETGCDDTVILRIEQLYPFPVEELCALLSTYKNADEVVWCQEEPMNQGAWFCTQHHLRTCLRKSQVLHYAGRDFSASPASGHAAVHKKQQAALVAQAFAAFGEPS